MPDDNAFTPTVADLRAIAEFLRDRSYDEARGAGLMEFFGQSGVTIQGRFPKRYSNGTSPAAEDRGKVAAWIDGHGPDRFVGMASALASMAEALADALFDVPEAYAPHRVRMMWHPLTRAARLWESHPDFDPAWAKDEDDGT